MSKSSSPSPLSEAMAAGGHVCDAPSAATVAYPDSEKHKGVLRDDGEEEDTKKRSVTNMGDATPARFARRLSPVSMVNPSAHSETEKERRDRIQAERRVRKEQREENRKAKRLRRLERIRQKEQHNDDIHKIATEPRKEELKRNQTKRKDASIVQRSDQSAPERISSLRGDSKKRQRLNDNLPTASKGDETTDSPNSELEGPRVLRVAVVGCGGWFANKAHLPALADIIRTQQKQRQNAKFAIQITVLCGSSEGAARAVNTIRERLNATKSTWEWKLISGGSSSFPDHNYDNNLDSKSSTCSNKQRIVRFETLEDYLAFEGSCDEEEEEEENNSKADEDVIAPCTTKKAGVSASNSIHCREGRNARSLADVCILCLPIPKMVAAVGLCLRFGKFVISEKPASPRHSYSESLWDSCLYWCKRGSKRSSRPTWLVSENWAYKPSLKAMARQIQREIIQQQHPPVSYELHVVQKLNCAAKGWRCDDGDGAYSGGTFRDTGVHYIRCLRRLFGEITEVQDCHFDSSTSVADANKHAAAEERMPRVRRNRMKGRLHHDCPSRIRLSGTAHVEHREDIVSGAQSIATLTVKFPTSSVIWDMAKSTISRQEPAAVGSDHDCGSADERIKGDDWISGGVRECLVDAFSSLACEMFGADGLEFQLEHQPSFGLRCCPEEALRDVSVVDAMVYNAQEKAGMRLSHGEAENETTTTGPYRPSPVGIRFASGTSPSVVNSTATSCYNPTAICRPASVEDLVQAAREAKHDGLFFQPVGTCHSTSIIRDAAYFVWTGLLSRVLDCCVLKKESVWGQRDAGPAALIRVQSGLTLHQLYTFLEESPFSLPTWPVLLHQTVGGAISSGSHGSSTKFGPLSNYVMAARLVSSDGQIITVVSEGPKPAELLNIINENHSEVLECDKTLRIVQRGIGICGVIVDVVFGLVKNRQLRKREIELNMKEENVEETIRNLASSTEHCWIQWRLGDAEGNHDDFACAIVMEPLASDTTSDGSLVGTEMMRTVKFWELKGPLMTALWGGAREANCGERKFTMQMSYPLCDLKELLAALASLKSEFGRRVFELKFLPGASAMALAERGSADSFTTTPRVAVNVWWDAANEDALKLLDSTLSSISHGQHHYGKWLPAHLDAPSCQAGKDELLRIGAKFRRTESEPMRKTSPLLSVILPVYNAMPWFPVALRDVLKQDVEGEEIEVLSGDDCSRDGSLRFAVEVAMHLGDRGTVELVQDDGSIRVASPSEGLDITRRREKKSGAVRSVNPAHIMVSRAADMNVTKISPVPRSELELLDALTPKDVAQQTSRRSCLRVIVLESDLNCGQGKVMTRCLRCARGKFIGHMESDDERPDGAFASLVDGLWRHPEWDGATSLTRCIGWDSEGMQRYVDWQNEQDTPQKMSAARFVEIPSLHQAGVFRRDAVFRSIGGERGSYRDDKTWAVDMHFWLSFFDQNLVVGKVKKHLFLWRQHPGQQTRLHGRLSIENLRKCKCHFLCKEKGFIFGQTTCEKVIEVWSTGRTLVGWLEDLKDELHERGLSDVELVGVDWAPGQACPVSSFNQLSMEGQPRTRIRLFGFGMEKAQKKARDQLSESWDDSCDVFVA